jgi:hypothetical protein
MMIPVIRHLALLVFVLLTRSSPTTAQRAPTSPTRYRAQAGPLLYETTNPYHMYWVRGADTIGRPWRERSVERQEWSAAGPELRVLIKGHSFDVEGEERADTFLVTAAGRVRQVNGKAPGLNTQVDLVPFFPTTPLVPGTRWRDTLAATTDGPAGSHRFEVIRDYSVARVTDSARMRIAEVTATGTVHYRDGWWSDSAAGSYSWLDVAGPMEESFRVDLTTGRILERRWRMDLVGTGGRPREGGGTDTLPAGLRSASTDRLIDPTRMAVIDPVLPGADTSWTVQEGAILRHTVSRGGDSVASSMTRNDGLVGIARTRFRDGRPETYTSVWVDSIGTVTTDTIRVDRRGLRLKTVGGRDTLVAPPTSIWGIADYAMQEHLVPVLLSLDEDFSEAPFAIYRPVARHWDTGSVTFVPRGGAVIITIQMQGAEKPQYLLLTEDGDLLYAENSDPKGAQRVPMVGSARRARLEQLLAGLRGG